MEWGFDIGGEVSQGFDRGGRGGGRMGRRAPKRVDGLLDLFNPASSTDARRKELDSRGARFTGRVSNPSIGESSEHASSVVDVTAETTRAGGRGAGRVGRSSARGAIAGRGARGEPRLRGVRRAPGLGRRPRRSARRLRVPWWCSATTRRRARGGSQAARVRARSARARVAPAGDPGVAIRGRVDDRREASARSDASMPAGGGEGRRRARRCERGERGARATRPGGRSGSIDPRASNRHAIKQGISSGVD